MIRERQRPATSGWPVLWVLLAMAAFAAYTAVHAFVRGSEWWGLGWAFIFVVCLVCLCGFFVVNPNEGLVLLLFGDYRGTVREAGWRWANPFLTKRRISLRVRNFESGRLKVNDRDGNPVEIAAVVGWRVVDTAEAVFEVDDYQDYVKIQSEAAVRNLATRYPYDTHEE